MKPEYYFNVINQGEGPRVIIYRRSAPGEKLLPICEPIETDSKQIARLIRDLAEHLVCESKRA